MGEKQKLFHNDGLKIKKLKPLPPKKEIEDIDKVREILFGKSINKLEKQILESNNSLKIKLDDEIAARQAAISEIRDNINLLRQSLDKKIKTLDEEKVNVKKLFDFFGKMANEINQKVLD